MPNGATCKGRLAAGFGPTGIGGSFLGKRSTFDRVPRDLYNTPAKAVRPLLGWLKPGTRFIEPCYGEGALAGILEASGHRLVGSFDLPTDARVHSYGVAPGEIFVTNPPHWGRPRELHPLIENLSDQAPTWLLMSADWLFNDSSGPLIAKRLRRVVAVGRVKWIPGSPYVGKDNAAWLLFYRYGRRATFIGRSAIKRHEPDALRTRANQSASLAGVADGRERAGSDAGLSETSRGTEGVQNARSR